MVKQARNLKEKYILVEGRLCRDVYERPLRTQELSLEWECQTPVSLPSPGGGHGICSTLNGMLSTNEWMHLGYKHLPPLSSPLTASRALSEALIHRPARVRAKDCRNDTGRWWGCQETCFDGCHCAVSHSSNISRDGPARVQAVHSTRTRQASTMGLRKGRTGPVDLLPF